MVDISKFNFKTEPWSARLFERDVYIDENEQTQLPPDQKAKFEGLGEFCPECGKLATIECEECGLMCEEHGQLLHSFKKFQNHTLVPLKTNSAPILSGPTQPTPKHTQTDLIFQNFGMEL